jgi:hypothetical protein
MIFTKMEPEMQGRILLKYRGTESSNLWIVIYVLQVTRISKNDGDAENEQMLQTKMEIKNRSRDYHFFHKVQVSKLNVLVSYKASHSTPYIL